MSRRELREGVRATPMDPLALARLDGVFGGIGVPHP